MGETTSTENYMKRMKEDKKMRTKFQIIALALGIAFSFHSQAQTGDAVFPKGELSTTKNHTGNVWLKELNAGD
jgi:hypothetical protein